MKHCEQTGMELLTEWFQKMHGQKNANGKWAKMSLQIMPPEYLRRKLIKDKMLPSNFFQGKSLDLDKENLTLSFDGKKIASFGKVTEPVDVANNVA